MVVAEQGEREKNAFGAFETSKHLETVFRSVTAPVAQMSPFLERSWHSTSILQLSELWGGGGGGAGANFPACLAPLILG